MRCARTLLCAATLAAVSLAGHAQPQPQTHDVAVTARVIVKFKAAAGDATGKFGGHVERAAGG